MKLVRMRVSTTHVDRHNERFTRKALEGAAEQATGHYITVMWNHDIRYPPLGRTTAAQVVRLDDGEYALENTAEIWEDGDTAESLRGDGRSVRTRTDAEHEKFIVRYDRTFRDEDGWGLVKELADLSSSAPQEEGKKALDPVSTLAIAVGALTIGGIATGFLQALGSDIYHALKTKLKNFFQRHPNREVLVDFAFNVESSNQRFEVHLLLDNADPRKVESVFAGGLNQVDEIVKEVHSKMPDVGRIVVGWHDTAARLLYVVRKDGVPFAPDEQGNLTLQKALEQLRDVPDFPSSSIGGGVKRPRTD